MLEKDQFTWIKYLTHDRTNTHRTKKNRCLFDNVPL